MYLFQTGSDGSWSEVAILVAIDGSTNDEFGRSVCVDAGTVVVGSYGHDIGSNASEYNNTALYNILPATV